MDLPLDQRRRNSKNPPSSIQTRWTLKATDINSIVYIHMSTEQYLPPSYPWMLMGEERFSTILQEYILGIYWCRKGFGGSRHFWRKDHSDYVLLQHWNKCHPTHISVPQTLCHQQECLPKEHYWGLVSFHNQPLAPDSWQWKCLMPNQRRWKFQSQ